MHVKSIEAPLRFTAYENPKLCIFYDGSYTLHKCEGRVGMEAFIMNEEEKVPDMRESNLFAWKSKKLTKKLISSTSSELCALSDVVKKAFAWKKLAERLWRKKVPVEFMTDSGPLME